MMKAFTDNLKLNNGILMPRHGFGAYKLVDEGELHRSLETAVETGYRLFDTAQFYHNEKYIGDFFSLLWAKA